MRDIKEKIILVGGGGHAKVVIDAIKRSENFENYGVLDPNLTNGMSVLGVPVLGSDDKLAEIFKNNIRNAFISIGSIGNCKIRKKLYVTLKNIGFNLPIIAHPNAVISEYASLKEGTFIAAGVVINPGVEIGRNVVVNTSSSIDHDCKIGDFVHVAPGAVICGGVKIGDETHVGAGAIVIQYLNIGKNCIIAAGTTIRHNMKDDAKSYRTRKANQYATE